MCRPDAQRGRIARPRAGDGSASLLAVISKFYEHVRHGVLWGAAVNHAFNLKLSMEATGQLPEPAL
eukprot:2335643-Pyramimonas_sp.AAC.1